MGLRAAFLFHLETGIPVVWRLGVLQVGLVLFALGQAPDPAGLLKAAALGIGSGSLIWCLGLGVWCLVLAGEAARRERSVLEGWARHLPVSRTTRRAAMVLSLAMAQVVPILAWLLLWAYAAALGPVPSWTTLLAVIPVTVAAGGIQLAPALPGGRSRPGRDLLSGSSAHALPWLVSFRALGWSVASVLAGSVLLVAATALVLRNNPELTPAQTALTVRFGCGVAVVGLILRMGSRLCERRPPWPWSRSWPWTSSRRIGNDVLLLFALTLPVLGATVVLHPGAALAVTTLSLFSAIGTAGSMRRNGDSLTTLGRGVAMECGIALGITGLYSFGAVLPAVLLPALWLRAVARERSHKVGALREQHYWQAGDSLS